MKEIQTKGEAAAKQARDYIDKGVWLKHGSRAHEEEQDGYQQWIKEIREILSQDVLVKMANKYSLYSWFGAGRTPREMANIYLKA